MHILQTVASVLFLYSCFLSFTEQQYTPDWDSIDSRPLPGWYDDSKIGIFIHWGVFSVPSFGTEWYVFPLTHCCLSYLCRMWYFWKGPTPDAGIVAFMNRTYPPDWTYADFAAQFRAEFYGTYKQQLTFDVIIFPLYLDPNEWADILAASGAKYVRSICK